MIVTEADSEYLQIMKAPPALTAGKSAAENW